MREAGLAGLRTAATHTPRQMPGRGLACNAKRGLRATARAVDTDRIRRAGVATVERAVEALADAVRAFTISVCCRG